MQPALFAQGAEPGICSVTLVGKQEGPDRRVQLVDDALPRGDRVRRRLQLAPEVTQDDLPVQIAR